MAEPRVLVGPLYDPKLIGRFRHSANILTFRHDDRERVKAHTYDLVYDLFSIKHFNDILAFLPEGWEPDLIIWWDTVYQPLPAGIEDCPYPTALIPGDWNLAYQTISSLASAFDVVLTDKRLKGILEERGFENCFYWRCFSYDSESLYLMPDVKRIYDIGFIGNLAEQIHTRRGFYLDQILQHFSQDYRVHFAQGVWGDDYRKVLNQSKIVFNYTICQVLNMRAFEAPACGALLFIEEENVEVRDVFQDRENCVLYNQNTLVPLLQYYLTHDPERIQIAEQGHNLVQNFSNEKVFEQLLNLIPEILNLARKSNRPFKTISREQRLFLHLRQLAGSNATGLNLAQSKIHSRMSELRSNELQPSAVFLLNMAVFLYFPVQCLELNTLLTKETRAYLEQIKLWLEMAIPLQPENPLLYYHKALTLECLGEIKLSMWNYSRCIELQAQRKYKDLLEMKLYILPFSRQQASHFIAVQWGRFSYEYSESQLHHFVGLLNSYIWSRLGYLLEQENRLEKALKAYENAIENYVDPYYYIKIAQIKSMQGDSLNAWHYFNLGLTSQPLLIRYLSEVLTPKMLIENWPALGRILRPYHGFEQLNLAFYDYLCGLCERLSLSAFSLSDICEYLKTPFYPKLYRWLGPVLAAFMKPALSPLARLKKPCEVSFKVALEPFPKFENEAGFVQVLNNKPELFLSDKIFVQNELIFQRVYDQVSDLELKRVGPDLLPCFFPTDPNPKIDPKSILYELWGDDISSDTGLYVLLLYRTLYPEQIKAYFEILEVYNSTHPEQPFHLILWSPEGTAMEVERLSLFFSEDSTTQVLMLSESLSLNEQNQLLKKQTFVLAGEAEKSLNFYCWWALYLGVPVYYWGTLWNPYQDFDSEISFADCEIRNKEELCRGINNETSTQVKIAKIQQQLIHFYKHQAYNCFVKACWQMRLQLVIQDRGAYDL